MRSHYLLLIACTVSILLSLSATLFYTFVLAQQQEPRVSAIQVDVADTELNFLWSIIELNSLSTLKPQTQLEKKKEIENLVKRITALVTVQCKLYQKYASVLPSSEVNAGIKNCTELIGFSVSEKVMIAPWFITKSNELSKQIAQILVERNLLDSPSNFTEFNKYIFINDESYVEVSENFFEKTERDTSKVWFTPMADEIIYKIAGVRGFKPKKVVLEANLIEFSQGLRLQKDTAKHLLELKEAASKDGITIEVISAYRSPDDQKTLFLEEMKKYNIAVTRLSDPSYVETKDFKASLNKVMERAAPPGYSKHHTGTTIDIFEPGSAYFGQTRAYQWISANNYAQAKKFGFLPSYPKLSDTVKFGPNPEEWEYFYVGKEVTYD